MLQTIYRYSGIWILLITGFFYVLSFSLSPIENVKNIRKLNTILDNVNDGVINKDLEDTTQPKTESSTSIPEPEKIQKKNITKLEKEEINPKTIIKEDRPIIEKKDFPFIIGVDLVPIDRTPLWYKVKEQDGVVITKIYDGSIASKLDLKVDDVILEVDDQRFYLSKGTFISLIRDKEQVKFKIWRDGNRGYLNVPIK